MISSVQAVSNCALVPDIPTIDVWSPVLVFSTVASKVTVNVLPAVIAIDASVGIKGIFLRVAILLF